jgi:hypothetical protein
MTIPDALLHDLAVHRRAGRRAGLVVRHAERHPIVDLRTHHTLLLTERGHVMADDAGRALVATLATGGAARDAATAPAAAARATSTLRLRAVHSPVERCAETARGLVRGARACGIAAVVHGPDVALGDPFLRDRHQALALAHELGPAFLRAWFDGRVGDDVLQDHRAAARDQVAAWARHVDDAGDDASGGDVVVLVSHDWNVALVREVVLGVRHEETWPHFLDGVVVALDGDEVVVAYDGRAARVPLTARTPIAG